MDGALLFCRLEGQRHDLLLSALSRGEKWFDLSLKRNHSGISVATGLQGDAYWEMRSLVMKVINGSEVRRWWL